MMRAATLALLSILFGWGSLSTADHAFAKPYGPPGWAVLNGPGLPSDVFLSLDRAAAFGTFEATCIRGPRQSTPPRQDWVGWQVYEATIFYAMPIESGRQAFVTKQTLYVNRGIEGHVYIHSVMTILDPAGQATGWGDCHDKWVSLTQDQLAVLEEQVDRYSNTQYFMVFGCRRAAPGHLNPYRALATPTCQ